jgi:RecA-family ATPase
MIRTPELVEALAGQTGPRFKLRRFDELKIGTERTYLVKGLIPRTGLVVVWGPPKCGKSFWTFDLVLHVALGREYRGRRSLPINLSNLQCRLFSPRRLTQSLT